MRRALVMAAVAAAVFTSGVAYAAVPRLINFQGRLADSSGSPLTGSYSMTFSVWNASSGGTACFTEVQAVAVNSGLFNVNIGSASGGIASACDFSVPYHLQLQVSTDTPMSPRFALTAAAYALRAQVADDSVKLNGLTQGNAAGQIPSNNGVVQAGLNADKLDGYDATALLPTVPVFSVSSLCDGYGTFGGAVLMTSSASCTWTTIAKKTIMCATPAACPAGCSQTAYSTACAENPICGIQSTLGPTYYECNYRLCSCPNTRIGYVKP